MFGFIRKKYFEYKMKERKKNILNDLNIKNESKPLKKENKDAFYIGDEAFPFVDNHSKTFLVNGPAGSGKSLKVFFPNIINEKEHSMVILDRCEEMFSKTSEYLKDKGYEIVVLTSKNLDDNIFCNDRYSYISKEEEIEDYLNNIFNIKDEDDYYNSLEVNVFKCFFKQLLLKNESLSFLEVFNYFKDLEYDEFRAFFISDDEYINKYMDEFCFFYKIEDKGDFIDFKNKFFNKYDFFKKKENDIFFEGYHFEYLRSHKVALFISLDGFFHSYEDNGYSRLVGQCMEQMIRFPEGRQVRFFLDEFEVLKKIDNFERLMVLSRRYNYSIFMGIQHFDNLEDVYGSGFSTIMANISNVVVLGPIYGKTSYYIDNLFGTRASEYLQDENLIKNENYFLARINEKNQFENNLLDFKIEKTFKLLNENFYKIPIK